MYNKIISITRESNFNFLLLIKCFISTLEPMHGNDIVYEYLLL